MADGQQGAATLDFQEDGQQQARPRAAAAPKGKAQALDFQEEQPAAAKDTAPRTTYHSNPSFAGYAPPNSPARTVTQTPAAREHQDAVLPYIHDPASAPNAGAFKLGAEAIPLGLGIGGAIEEGGLNAPTLLKFGRSLIGGAAGAYGGQKIGGSVGGMFGETGRKVGEGLGAVGGGLYGGSLATGLEREPATMNQALAGQPGRIKAMPFGIQRAMPEWMVPGPSEEALATAQSRAQQEQIGSFMNRGYTPQKIGSGSGSIIDIGDGSPEQSGSPNDLISRTRALVHPGEQPGPEDLKRAGDLTQAPLKRLQDLAKFGDELAKNEINRRLRNQ